jgi:hypothetical protein
MGFLRSMLGIVGYADYALAHETLALPEAWARRLDWDERGFASARRGYFQSFMDLKMMPFVFPLS